MTSGVETFRMYAKAKKRRVQAKNGYNLIDMLQENAGFEKNKGKSKIGV